PDLALPSELVSLCLKCLEKDPNRRPISAAEVLATLDSLSPPDVPAPARVPAQVASHPTVDVEPPIVPATAELSDADLRPPAPPPPPPPRRPPPPRPAAPRPPGRLRPPSPFPPPPPPRPPPPPPPAPRPRPPPLPRPPSPPLPRPAPPPPPPFPPRPTTA